MRLSASGVRFLLETALIVGVAAATAVARLDKLWIGIAVGSAWLLVALLERAAKQDGGLLRNGPLAFLFPRRGEDARVSLDTPAASPATHASLEHPEPAPLPDPPAPEPAPPAPDPEPPRPEPEQPTPQLRPVPAEEPELEPEPQPEPEPSRVVPFRARGDGAPREWNVWELERLAREREGQDPARDQEVAFLLLELRQFANAEGRLPLSFDPVIREAFGDALYSAV